MKISYRPHRLRDLADVQDLISALSLPLELGESMRVEYPQSPLARPASSRQQTLAVRTARRLGRTLFGMPPCP